MTNQCTDDDARTYARNQLRIEAILLAMGPQTSISDAIQEFYRQEAIGDRSEYDTLRLLVSNQKKTIAILQGELAQMRTRNYLLDAKYGEAKAELDEIRARRWWRLWR